MSKGEAGRNDGRTQRRGGRFHLGTVNPRETPEAAEGKIRGYGKGSKKKLRFVRQKKKKRKKPRLKGRAAEKRKRNGFGD